MSEGASHTDPYVAKLFSSAQKAAKAGYKHKARQFLWEALRVAPDDPELWIWLAGVAPSPRACMTCLSQALSLDPNNQRAKAGLRWARRQIVESQPKQPAVPPPGKNKRRTRHLVLWPAATALLVIIAAAIVLYPSIAALAAGASPTQQNSSFLTQAVTSSPTFTATMAPVEETTTLPTRTPAIPPTWTPTWTATPSLTPSATPTPTPTSTETPTPIPSPTWVPTALPTPMMPGSDGERWIDVNLTEQLLIAYEGETPVYWVLVSTGLPRTPTVVGQFRIYAKYEYADMTGENYDLPDVPYTMYFYKDYGLHGTYWHSNFGHPMSHGCVNLPTPDAEWLYGFASIGTLVNIHY